MHAQQEILSIQNLLSAVVSFHASAKPTEECYYGNHGTAVVE